MLSPRLSSLPHLRASVRTGQGLHKTTAREAVDRHERRTELVRINDGLVCLCVVTRLPSAPCVRPFIWPDAYHADHWLLACLFIHLCVRWTLLISLTVANGFGLHR